MSVFQLVGRFAGALTKAGPLTDGQILVGQSGAVPLAKTVSGDGTLSALGVLTILALASARLGKEGAVINVRGMTTANDSLAGLAARDGLTPVAGERWLVKDHATGASKGIYVAAAGAWARLTDAAGGNSLRPGVLVVVNEGTTGAGLIYRCTNATLSVGVDTPAFALITAPFAATLASVANGFGAALIGLEDAAGKVTATTVEGAIAEIAADGYVTAAHLGAAAVTFAKAKVFISTEQTATGSAQNVAHGLGAVPAKVLIVPTETTDAGIIAGGFDVAEGSHDGTNVVLTATANLKFKVMAWA